jgi:pyruvate/2-oxoglutarate dehydrogenase complex dihydrolipoamide acyltransferase (E2) component
MVNIPDDKKDLSVLNIQNADQLNLAEIQEQIEHKAHFIRKREDPHLGPILFLISLLPKTFLKFFLRIYSTSIYELKVRLKTRYFPHRPFGSIIISNVGSLGIKKVLLPLVPLARPALMVSLGKIDAEVKPFQGRIEIRQIAHLGITFDHRLFDGSHAAKMLNDFEKSFQSLKMT